MKIKFLLLAVIGIFISVSVNAQIASDNIKPGLNVAKSFNDNSFHAAEVYVYIPDSAATYYNLHSAVGYEIDLDKSSIWAMLPYLEVQKSTYHKSKEDNFKVGVVFNYTAADSGKNFILDNFFDFRYKRDYLPKTYNSLAFSYYLNMYFPSIKSDIIKALVPTGKRLTIIDSLLKYKNNFAIGADYEQHLNDPDPENFKQNTTLMANLDWNLYFLKDGKRDLVDIAVSYHINTKLEFDKQNKKYFNLFKASVTYFFFNDGRNNAGLKYEIARGDKGVHDVAHDSYQKVMFTFKLSL